MLKRYSIFIPLLVALYGGMWSFAAAQATTSTDHSSDPTLESLTRQIQELTAMVASLQQQLAQVRSQQSDIQTQIAETRREFRLSLREGMKNNEVAILQEFLAMDPEVYPEGMITGYYGPLTAKAVKRFQKKHGIEAIGIVGPKTRAKLNEMYGDDWALILDRHGKHKQKKHHRKEEEKDNHSEKKEKQNKVRIHQRVEVSASSSVSENDEVVSQSSVDFLLVDNKALVCHKGHERFVPLTALGGHVAHGDRIGHCTGMYQNDDRKHDTQNRDDRHDDMDDDQEDNDVDNADDQASDDNDDENDDGDDGDDANDETQDTNDANSDIDAPVITDISVIASGTAAVISWSTNEPTTGSVRYDTVPPASFTAATPTVHSDPLSITHSITLDSLATSTHYYIEIEAIDSAGNTSTATTTVTTN